MSKDRPSADYGDIIDMSHHVSSGRKPMPRSARAAQFAPFAALTGYDAAIAETARQTTEMKELSEDARAELDMKLQMLIDAADTAPEVTVTYFMRDDRKSGGAYIRLTGTVREIDLTDSVMLMSGGERIPLSCVSDMDSRLFDGML